MVVQRHSLILLVAYCWLNVGCSLLFESTEQGPTLKFDAGQSIFDADLISPDADLTPMPDADLTPTPDAMPAGNRALTIIVSGVVGSSVSVAGFDIADTCFSPISQTDFECSFSYPVTTMLTLDGSPDANFGGWLSTPTGCGPANIENPGSFDLQEDCTVSVTFPDSGM